MGYALLENAWTVTTIAKPHTIIVGKNASRTVISGSRQGRCIYVMYREYVDTYVYGDVYGHAGTRVCVHARLRCIFPALIYVCTRTGRIVRSCICIADWAMIRDHRSWLLWETWRKVITAGATKAHPSFLRAGACIRDHALPIKGYE